MPNNFENRKNEFYEGGLKLLLNKFMTALHDPDGELHKMNEGVERKFEVWSARFISDSKTKNDVWKLFLKEVRKKNG